MVVSQEISLAERVLRLKRERNAVILVHNYQLGEIQDIADFIGDSLGLSQNAAKTEADVIVFCGVHFMAETAAILCPDMKVLLPDSHAGCPMANMITAEQLRQRKKELPHASVVCYINSTAEVKAESDICCTSANAVQVVESVTNDEILFVPDQYLGHYISTKVKKKIHFWPGYCPTHARIRPQDIIQLKQEYPQAKVVVHPECRPEVIELADEVMSTGGMIRYARRDDVRELIVGTELGIIHRLKKENPGKMEKVLWSLEEMAPEVTVPEEIRLKAKEAVDKMLAIV
jgi:quinolinate synthase